MVKSCGGGMFHVVSTRNRLVQVLGDVVGGKPSLAGVLLFLQLVLRRVLPAVEAQGAMLGLQA